MENTMQEPEADGYYAENEMGDDKIDLSFLGDDEETKKEDEE